MTPINCFMCVVTDQTQLSLRRYASRPDIKCEPYGYHNAHTVIGPRTVQLDADGNERCVKEEFARSAPEWPTGCEHCDYQFVASDGWQHFTSRLYRREDTGTIATWEEMPVGAVRDCWWLHDCASCCGPDGRCIMVKIPEKQDGTGTHDWMVDGRANNCTLPQDNIHRCWCRHGLPPNLHVDKNPEPGRSTCAAGAGSILVPGGFHGFLHHNQIVG